MIGQFSCLCARAWLGYDGLLRLNQSSLLCDAVRQLIGCSSIQFSVRACFHYASATANRSTLGQGSHSPATATPKVRDANDASDGAGTCSNSGSQSPLASNGLLGSSKPKTDVASDKAATERFIESAGMTVPASTARAGAQRKNEALTSSVVAESGRLART